MRSSIILFLALLISGCDQLFHDASSKPDSAHYQLVTDTNGNAWRLDTITGEMKRCWQGNPVGNDFPPTCYLAIQK
jgi:hypothetical protein